MHGNECWCGRSAFRGRKIYIGGDRTFDTWSITVLNDTNFKIRNAMERWQWYQQYVR